MTAPIVLPATGVKKMGPGVLSIGATGSVLDFSARCTKVQLKWKKSAKDGVTVLSGATIAGDVDYTAQLTATVYQGDLMTGGLVAYTWANKGTEVPFVFQPNSAEPSIVGTLVLDPIDVGGDVDAKNTSDLQWDCVGEPTLQDDLT